MSQEKVGIVLTAGYEPKFPRNGEEPRYPNLMGRFRLVGAASALIDGRVDILYVVGGMPDNRGFPVEIGHSEYLKRILANPRFAGENGLSLASKVAVLPRTTTTVETWSDLKEAKRVLEERAQSRDVTIISNGYHLFPRTLAISHIEKLPDVKLLSAEELLWSGWGETKNCASILNRVVPREFLVRQYPRELALTTLLIISDILRLNGIVHRFIAGMAWERRVKQGKIY